MQQELEKLKEENAKLRQLLREFVYEYWQSNHSSGDPYQDPLMILATDLLGD